LKQKVVVIGHGYTSRLGVIRALGRVGYEVIVVVMTSYNQNGTLNTTKPIDCYSKYVSKVYYCFSDREQLISLLLEKCADPNQKVVLFTDSDFSEAAVDENQEKLRDSFLFPHINHQTGAVVAWMDKIRQKKVAQSVGLDVAKGWVVEVADGDYVIPTEIEYPCFPKPLATIVGGKGGLRKCNTEEDLRNVIAGLVQRKPTITILVEEYKEIQTEHALVGFSDGREVVIPGIIQTMSLANGGHFGVAKQGKIMPMTEFEDLVGRFNQFVRQTEFVGIFDIDFYKSDNKYYFCEMNFRYGGSGYAYTAMGVNLPDMLVRTLTGKTIEGMQRQITREAVFVNERMCKDDWVGNYISTKELAQLLRSADVSFVIDTEDTKPQKIFYKSLRNPIVNLKRIVKRLLKRK
jgi:biotin carboxylase